MVKWLLFVFFTLIHLITEIYCTVFDNLKRLANSFFFFQSSKALHQGRDTCRSTKNRVI